MQQWHSIRSQLPEDTLLFFRLGDFYEIFHQDAEKGAKLLTAVCTSSIPRTGNYAAVVRFEGEKLKTVRKNFKRSAMADEVCP